QLYLESLTTKDIAYVGMDYTDVEPIAKMYALVGENKEYIDGVTTWRYNAGMIDEENVVNNKVTNYVCFEPDEKYLGNYQGVEKEDGSIIQYTGEFQVEYLSITFDAFEKLKLRMVVNTITYNDSLSYENVATLFDKAFAQELEKDPMLEKVLGGQSPAFVIDGKEMLVSDYRKATNEGGTYAIAFANIKESFSIVVTLLPATYKVKYKTDSNTWEDTKEYRYGMHVDEPTPPTKDGELFVGWYYNAAEPDSATAKPDTLWDFDHSPIMYNLHLTAKFLRADRITDLRVTVLNKNIMAFDTLKEGDLKVEAYYVGGTEGSEDYLADWAEVPWGSYTITYTNALRKLQVSNTTNISDTVNISYTFGQPQN
ncbi:MAG: InlB B-repeat-containing protein, partial [Clostridia bacterium]|nr:InlB B-repeat-containing protein [Clostridia bacterium]